MNAQTQNNSVERVNAYLEEQASLDTLRPPPAARSTTESPPKWADAPSRRS